MLVLSRKAGERIRIGDEITVTVVRITGGGVRIGIEAPDELPVMRDELHPGAEPTDPKASPTYDHADPEICGPS